MKLKTSVSLSRATLRKLKALAKAQDRSVSYVLERFIEERVKELPEHLGAEHPRPGGATPSNNPGNPHHHGGDGHHGVRLRRYGRDAISVALAASVLFSSIFFQRKAERKIQRLSHALVQL